jgi:hypothetical protein
MRIGRKHQHKCFNFTHSTIHICLYILHLDEDPVSARTSNDNGECKETHRQAGILTALPYI